MGVWIVQESPGKNVLSAGKYGALDVLLPITAQVVLDSTTTIHTCRRKLRGFGDEDYLIAIGDPAAIGIACAVAASENRGRFKLLKWDRDSRAYFSIQVDVGVTP
jgi:hypothetical protein